MKGLVETSFLISLNPDSKYHTWAIDILKKARGGSIDLYISPISPVELSLILRSREVDEESISDTLSALATIIGRYVKPKYPVLTIEHLSYAAKLRNRYSQLTFFDSIHLAIALLNKIQYIDKDKVIKQVFSEETLK